MYLSSERRKPKVSLNTDKLTDPENAGTDLQGSTQASSYTGISLTLRRSWTMLSNLILRVLLWLEEE